MKGLSLGPGRFHTTDMPAHTQTHTLRLGRGPGRDQSAWPTPRGAAVPTLPLWAAAWPALSSGQPHPPGSGMQPRIKGPFGWACEQGCQERIWER